MAWTRHGHQIEDTPVEPGDKPPTARCGGPALCANCALDVTKEKNKKTYKEEIVCYNDNTLIKVYEILNKCFLTKAEQTDIVERLQEGGILFREKLKYI